MGSKQEIIYIDDTDEDDRVRREAECDRIRNEAVLATRKKIFSLEPPSEDESSSESSGESSSSHRVVRVTKLMRRQPKPWPRGILPATKPAKAAWKRLAQSPVDTRLDREIRKPRHSTPAGKPTSAHGIASTVSPSATRKPRMSDSFVVKRPTIPATSTRKPSAIDSTSVKRPTTSTGHVSSRVDRTRTSNDKPSASVKPRSAISPAQNQAKRTVTSPAPVKQSTATSSKQGTISTIDNMNVKRPMVSVSRVGPPKTSLGSTARVCPTKTGSAKPKVADARKSVADRPETTGQANEAKRMSRPPAGVCASDSRPLEAVAADSNPVSSSVVPSAQHVHLRPYFDANKTFLTLTDGRVGWLIRKPDRKWPDLESARKTAEREFNRAFNAKLPASSFTDYPSDDDFERPPKRTKFVDRSHSFIRPYDHRCTDDEYGTEAFSTSDDDASARADPKKKKQSHRLQQNAEQDDSDDGTEEKWPIPRSASLQHGNDVAVAESPSPDHGNEEMRRRPSHDAEDSAEEQGIVSPQLPTDQDWQDLLAIGDPDANEQSVDPPYRLANEDRDAEEQRVEQEYVAVPDPEPERQLGQDHPGDPPQDPAPEPAPDPAPEPEPPVFPWATWPSHVVHIRQNFNPTELTFPNYPSFGLCGCTSPCRQDSCMNGRLHVFCDGDCCMFDGRCGNSLSGVECLQLAECRRGNGLTVITTEAIESGVILGEYMGELAVGITAPNSGYRLELTEKAEEAPNQRVSIDAVQYGTILRFMNHSCDANCRFVEVSNGRRHAAVVVTTKKIRAGEEVTVYYSHELWFVCRCGSDKCLHRDIRVTRDE